VQRRRAQLCRVGSQYAGDYAPNSVGNRFNIQGGRLDIRKKEGGRLDIMCHGLSK
jgi:hypothetical protein